MKLVEMDQPIQPKKDWDCVSVRGVVVRVCLMVHMHRFSSD